MRRLYLILTSLFLILSMLCLGGWAEEAAPRDPMTHNYILVIDNSRSTTGRHSLGSATDPSGLRFDAARLVYQNVLSTAASGGKGQLGVIVFCGPENCVSYGPLDITSDVGLLDAVIGSKLNEAANQDRRDNYTDITTALRTAQGMMRGFQEGSDTSVILLTDGVNDLTNQSDPFNRPENIQANNLSAQIVSDMKDSGADFQVVALTAPDAIKGTDDFMVFIDRLAEAGGGEKQDDGSVGNVLMATQTDLNSKLLQSLIKAESASESIQNIVEYTPVYEPFRVPYDGITDATVNITFMPEDKPLLEKVELVSPEGDELTLWEKSGKHEQAGIGVKEDRSYIMLSIPSPSAGDWVVVVTSQKTTDGDDSQVLINAVVRFNHSIRLKVEMNSFTNDSTR